MVGTPSYSKHTVNYGDRTVTYHTIVTNHDNVTIENIGSAHISNASGSPYGINGTFFYTTTPPSAAAADGYKAYDNYRIAINNGAQVRNRGTKNRLNAAADGNCGTLGWLKSKTVNGKSYFCKDIIRISDVSSGITDSDVKWAVGGCNLYLNDMSLTESQFNSKINTQFSDITSGSTTARTAIFYRSSGGTNDIVLVAAVGSSATGVVGSAKGPKPWELRQFIIDVFKNGINNPPGTICEGVMLDGGGSTQIAYKSSGSRVCVQAEQRAVRTMIKTPM